MDKEKQGLFLKDYNQRLSDGSYALRIGKEVPEGSVNLAYVHVPRIQPDENISLVDTSYSSDNVIPSDQLETIAVANGQGELEYVNIIGADEMQVRPPKEVFPSSKVNVTRKFKKRESRIENALFYKFEIFYHYDSKVAIPDEKGVYQTEKYAGKQIELTDENGNPLDDEYKYDIYVTPQAGNPRIYKVEIYLHKNTDQDNTIKVRYNHIDKVVRDELVQSVRSSVEFYTGADNIVKVDRRTKQMLEGGKLRIVNGASAFSQTTEDKVRSAMSSNSESEIFAVVPRNDGDGYKIIVPQKSESDPRSSKVFTHRVVATYKNSKGEDIKVTVGHISDWVTNSSVLLKNERMEYSGDKKNIGLSINGIRLGAKEMIQMSLPMGTPSIPDDAKYYIEDDKGNLLYHVTTLTDNADVETSINSEESNALEVKANKLKSSTWTNAVQDNVLLKSNPIPHKCTIIPEVQKTKWEFEWEVDGEGYTEKAQSFSGSWKICADVAFQKAKSIRSLDLLDKTKWGVIGASNKLDKWEYTYIPSINRNALRYIEAPDDMCGFYHKIDTVDGSDISAITKKDYQFSVKVRMTDPIDDDMIGVMFRVKDSKNYYMFAWEKDTISTTKQVYSSDNGEGIKGTSLPCNRIILDEYGCMMYQYDTASAESWSSTTSSSKYLASGFGDRHKRILRAMPTTKATASGTTWDTKTRYPTDKTGCSFKDITDQNSDVYSEAISKKGWEYNKDYKITVVVTGGIFKVYISETVGSSSLGELVCQGSDSTHKNGSYGVFSISQRWTYWHDFKLTDIFMESICSEEEKVTFSSASETKLSKYAAQDLLEPIIQKKVDDSYPDGTSEIIRYYNFSEGDFTIRIDDETGFIYGKSNNPSAGKTIRTSWSAKKNGLDVKGTGTVEFFADGHSIVSFSPKVLPTNQIPEEIKEFKWNTPIITTGENVVVEIGDKDEVQVTATLPAVKTIGKPYILPESAILKSNGIQSLAALFGEEGFYDSLEIPSETPLEDILLRIERGEVTKINSDGSAITTNPEHRVNYRFRCKKGEFFRLPVDQFQNQLGVNRLRLKSILTSSGKLNTAISVDVVAWTAFEDLEVVPVFAVKVEEKRKIEIEKPRVEQKNMEWSSWYVRVKNGKFFRRITLPYYESSSGEKIPEIYVAYPQLLSLLKKPEDIVEVDLEYSIPEYTNQEFYNKEVVLIERESPTILNEFAVQTRYAPLVLLPDKEKSYLEVYSIRANSLRRLRVSDVDASKGIIYLLDRIREQDEVYIRYAYTENWYTYRGFQKSNKFFHLDLNPTPGHRHTVAENGFHKWIPIDVDTEEFTINSDGVSNRELLVKQIHIYIRPVSIRKVSSTNPEDHGDVILGTARTKSLFHTDEEWWFNQKDRKYDPTMFRLAKIILQANTTMQDNITILDTRTRGGGLDEALSKEIIRQINIESLYHWDIGYFDGEAYQENGVIVIKLPRSILKSDKNPNGFHESEVQEAIAKHKAYGIMPIVEYYEEDASSLKYNITPNYEFLGGNHIGYYDASSSKGDYSIIHAAFGSGDNYVLQLNGAAEYSFILPGHLIQEEQYEISIKALKELSATSRKAGIVEVAYKNGEVEQFSLDSISHTQWMVYKKIIQVKSSVHYIRITLNKTSETRTGKILIDYVSCIPVLAVDEDTLEIHEI